MIATTQNFGPFSRASEVAVDRLVAVEVSHDLGLNVVAEGVETRDQCDRLRELGCDQGQGFLFGYPTAIDEARWL